MCFVGDLLARVLSLSLPGALFACLDSEQVGARSLARSCFEVRMLSLAHTTHVLCSRALSLSLAVCVRALSGSAAVAVAVNADVDVDVDFVVVL